MTQFSSPYLKEEAPGVWRGATTFEEFRGDVGAGWPDRLVGLAGADFSIIDEAPRLEAIVASQVDDAMSHAWDTLWNSKFKFGEILIRFYIDAYASGIRVKMGVGPVGEFSLDGTEVQIHTFSGTINSNIRRVSDNTLHGTGIGHGDLDPGSGTPYYLWCRARFDDAGSGQMRVRYRIENGDYDTPPDGTFWDDDITFAADDIGPFENRIGLWIRSTIGPTQISDRRVAFFSFTGDPLNFPLLTSADVVNEEGISQPEITAADPLQGTYVGLIGSPFVAIEQQEQDFVVPAAPAVITDEAIGAWVFSDYDQNGDGQRHVRDVSGNGNHLLFGGMPSADAYLGLIPIHKKVGVQSTGISSRNIGLPNTGQQYNVGDAGVERVRFTMNFTMSLAIGGTKAIIALQNGLGTYAFHWQVDGSQNLICFMTEDGGTNRGGSIADLDTAFTSWDDMWIRVEYDFITDQVVVETSLDGVVWAAFGSRSLGVDVAQMFQPSASARIEIGSENNFASNPAMSFTLFSMKAEEDSGAGYVEAWEEIMVNKVIADFDKGGAWGSVAAADPIISADTLRFDGSNGKRMVTFFHTGLKVVDQQFDVAAGEVLTAVEVWMQNDVDAGPQAGFSKRIRDAVTDIGWGSHIVNAAGTTFQVSDGVTESETTPTVLKDDLNLVCRIYEIDGVDGEIRHRELGELPQIDAYADQGGGSPSAGVSVGSYFSGNDTPVGNWLGSAVIKRELTTTEMEEVAAFLSGGRL